MYNVQLGFSVGRVKRMMAYIVSKADLKVKDALTVISYEINEDTAAPAVTNIRFSRMPSVKAGDYVCLKEAGETVISASSLRRSG
jgi:hypothetical protein